MNTNGLTDKEIKLFMDLLFKANNEQIEALNKVFRQEYLKRLKQ